MTRERKQVKTAEHVKHEFAPVFNEESRVLILGTVPSVKSREEGFYYGHPQNRFWKVMSALTGEAVPTTIDQKKKMLLSHGIAVWDVVDSCDISGSSDSSIRNVVPTDLSQVLAKSNIQMICGNGTTAVKLYQRYQQKTTGREIVLLPSTSPANAVWSLERLINEWGKIIGENIQ